MKDNKIELEEIIHEYVQKLSPNIEKAWPKHQLNAAQCEVFLHEQLLKPEAEKSVIQALLKKIDIFKNNDSAVQYTLSHHLLESLKHFKDQDAYKKLILGMLESSLQQEYGADMVPIKDRYGNTLFYITENGGFVTALNNQTPLQIPSNHDDIAKTLLPAQIQSITSANRDLGYLLGILYSRNNREAIPAADLKALYLFAKNQQSTSQAAHLKGKIEFPAHSAFKNDTLACKILGIGSHPKLHHN